MKIAALAHLAFQVRSLDASLAFYRDGLGMTERFRVTYRELLTRMADDAAAGNPHDVDPHTLAAYERRHDDPWLVYLDVAPRQFLELFPAIDPATVAVPTAGDRYSHLCLEVDDARAAHDRASSAGLGPEPLRFGLDGSWQFWLTDPDGRRIEMMQYTGDSLQLRPQ